MLWLVPAWIATLLATYLFGYYIRGLTKKIAELEKIVQSKVDKKPIKEEPASVLVDVTDEVQEAMWEHKQLMERLNPDEK